MTRRKVAEADVFINALEQHDSVIRLDERLKNLNTTLQDHTRSDEVRFQELTATQKATNQTLSTLQMSFQNLSGRLWGMAAIVTGAMSVLIPLVNIGINYILKATGAN